MNSRLYRILASVGVYISMVLMFYVHFNSDGPVFERIRFLIAAALFLIVLFLLRELTRLVACVVSILKGR